MKKIFFLFLIMSINIGSLIAQKPEKIYSFVKTDKSHEFYKQQVELWWKEIEKDIKNEDAWYNYYKANRNSYYTFKEVGSNLEKEQEWKRENAYNKNLEAIRDLIKKNIPNTFTDYVTRNRTPFDNETFDNINKAYDLKPDAGEIYPLMITHYELNANYDKRKEINRKMYETNELSSGLINYGYNVLMTLKPNSILLTYGDNETYPIWLLQDVYDLRKDVTVMVLPMLTVKDYRTIMFNKIGIPNNSSKNDNGTFEENQYEIAGYILSNVNLNEHPVYISLGASHTVKDFESNLYLVGLALEYSKTNIDNIALLRNNFENKYALDYTKIGFGYDISSSIVNKMNTNYFPGILKLYNYYKSAGDIDAAEKMKIIGLKIAEKNNQSWSDYAKSVLK